MNENFTIIVEAALKGDHRGYEALYNMTKQSAYFIALNISKNESDAMDILQNSYLRAFRNLKDLKEPEKFAKWLNRIVANESKTFIKKKKPLLFSDIEKSIIPAEEEIETKTDYIPHEYVDNAESNRLIMEIINNLDEDKRLVILMHYYQEMTVPEIAETLSLPVSTVKYKLYAARKDIKKAVDDLENKGTKLYSFTPLAILPIIFMCCANKSAAPEFSSIKKVILPKRAFLSTLTGKIVTAAGTFIMAAAIVITGCAISGNKNTDTSSDSKDTKNDIESHLMDDDNLSEDSDNNNSGVTDVPSLTILGENYEFPMKFDEFTSLGWECIETNMFENTDISEEMIGPNTASYLYFSNGDLQCIRFRIVNFGDDFVPYKDTYVVGIYLVDEYTEKSIRKIHNNVSYDGTTDALDTLSVPDNSIVIGEDIIPYHTTKDEVLEKLGPDATMTPGRILSYYFEEDAYQYSLYLTFDDNDIFTSFDLIVSRSNSNE